MESPIWMLVLPPEGAARQLGEKTWDALGSQLPAGQRRVFDTKTYLDGFDRLLKEPADSLVVDLANQALVVQCLDFRITHLLVLALSPITFFTVDLLRRQGIVTLHWFYEDFREAKYWPDVLPAYRHFLAIQRGPVEAACRDKGVEFRYLPTAATLPLDRPVRPCGERPVDIAFIGFPSDYRISVLETLARLGYRMAIAGSGWEAYRGSLEPCLAVRGWTGQEDAFRLLESARIGLQLPAQDPGSDREQDQVSPRVFDILAAGCQLLAEDSGLLRETLPGISFRVFRGAVGAAEAVRAALAEGISEKTVGENRAKVRREHSLERRVGEILALAR